MSGCEEKAAKAGEPSSLGGIFDACHREGEREREVERERGGERERERWRYSTPLLPPIHLIHRTRRKTFDYKSPPHRCKCLNSP